MTDDDMELFCLYAFTNYSTVSWIRTMNMFTSCNTVHRIRTNAVGTYFVINHFILINASFPSPY